MTTLTDILPKPFLVLGLLISIFLIVVGAVNLWVRYRMWHDDSWLVQQIYTGRHLLWLYVRCWAVIVVGVALSVYVQGGVAYVLCAVLVVCGLLAVVRGESLDEVRLRKSQIENQVLRSQLNPHFLYNTLNNIDALIWLDQARASQAVGDLSQLMRYFTYSNRRTTVPVGEESGHLEQLLALQRLRMTDPATLVYRCDIDDPRQPIAPLLLLPLVENCFKHCGSLTEPGAIRISLKVARGVLDYESSNNLPADDSPERLDRDFGQKDGASGSKPQRRGVGMEILRRRLALIYAGRFTLSAQRTGDRFETRLHVVLGG